VSSECQLIKSEYGAPEKERYKTLRKIGAKVRCAGRLFQKFVCKTGKVTPTDRPVAGLVGCSCRHPEMRIQCSTCQTQETHIRPMWFLSKRVSPQERDKVTILLQRTERICLQIQSDAHKMLECFAI